MNVDFDFMMQEKTTTIIDMDVVDIPGLLNVGYCQTRFDRYHFHSETGIIVMTSYIVDEKIGITKEELEEKSNGFFDYIPDDIETCKKYGAKYLVIVQLEGTTPDFYYICDDVTSDADGTDGICHSIHDYLYEIINKYDYHFKYGVIKDGKITNPFPMEIN